MKQPKNWLATSPLIHGGIYMLFVFGESSGVNLGVGKTPKSALKAAQRRLDRLKRDVARELERLESKGKS